MCQLNVWVWYYVPLLGKVEVLYYCAGQKHLCSSYNFSAVVLYNALFTSLVLDCNAACYLLSIGLNLCASVYNCNLNMEASCDEATRSDALSLSRHLNLHGQLLSGESNQLCLGIGIPYQIDKFETEGNFIYLKFFQLTIDLYSIACASRQSAWRLIYPVITQHLIAVECIY